MLISSCAQIVTPNGGKSDLNPPKTKSVIPLDKSINFSSNKIEFVFDEYIQLKDAQKQILISPPMKSFPELKVKGKKLIVEILDTLKPRTTYTINFGNAVTDITEYNPVKDFKYVFSTDSLLDSLKVSGIISNSFSQLPDDNMLVALYKTSNQNLDSCAQKNLPDYFAKSDKLGVFNIENVKEGDYYIAAFSDANSDYLYQSDDERIAFSDTLISLSKPETKIDLKSFLAEPFKLLVKKAVPSSNFLQIELNKRPKQKIEISTLQKLPTNWAKIEHSKNLDSIKVWFSNATLALDSINIIVNDGQKDLDTIDVNLKSMKKTNATGRSGKQILSITPSNLVTGKFLLPSTFLSIKASMPISNYDETKFFIVHSKDTSTCKIQKLDSLGRNFKIISEFIVDSAYTLRLKQGAFNSINGLENDTSHVDFRIQNPKDIGSLKLSINCLDSTMQYVYQLLNEQNAVVDEQKISGLKTLHYKQLQPGKFSLKLIADNNKNGFWDTGNYNKKQQPEKIYNYSGSLVVRPNWDLEETWDLVNIKPNKTTKK